MKYPLGLPLFPTIHVNSLVSAFHYVFPAEFRYDGETHPGWEFVYVESGQIRVRADDATYLLKSGEMVCHKPMEFHAIRPYHGAAAAIIFCFTCSEELMNFFNNKILFIDQRQKQYLNDIVRSASKILLPKDPLVIAADGCMDPIVTASSVDIQYVKNLIELLLLSLLSSESTERQKRIEYYAQHLQRKSLTTDIVTYLKTNLEQKILLSDIVDRFAYSPSSIKRIFKNEMGCSINDYLCDLRIEKAKELLRHQKKMTDIAEAIGFDTVNYFSLVFKRKTGMTPSEYRQKIKES